VISRHLDKILFVKPNYLYMINLITYKIVVFDEEYISFHFNIILNTTGCPLLKIGDKVKFISILNYASLLSVVYSNLYFIYLQYFNISNCKKGKAVP
jgi:hypothetical protein